MVEIRRAVSFLEERASVSITPRSSSRRASWGTPRPHPNWRWTLLGFPPISAGPKSPSNSQPLQPRPALTRMPLAQGTGRAIPGCSGKRAVEMQMLTPGRRVCWSRARAADDQQSLSQPIAQTSQRPPPSRDFPFLSTAARPAPATASGSVCPVPWLSLYVTTDVGGALALQKDVFQ